MKVVINNADVFVGNGGVAWQKGQRTLFFQHGAGMNRTVWVLLARYFARHGYNIVAADLPRHGASAGEPLQSIEDQAQHVWLLLDTLRQSHGLPGEPVVFAGHSMGALLVVEAASHRPESVEELLLFGAGYPMTVAQPLLDAAYANDQSAVDMISLYSHSFASQIGHNAVAGISVMNVAMAMLEQARPGVLFTDLQACNRYQSLQVAAAGLTKHGNVQCTVISGDADRMTPLKSAKAMVEYLNARHIILDNCGHMMMSEQPEQTLQVVKSILD